MVMHGFGICKVMGSILVEPKLNFIFAILGFGLKTDHKESMNDNKH